MPKYIPAVIIMTIQLIAAGTVWGLDLDYGARLGLNFTSFTGSDISDESKKTGIVAGLYFEKKIGPSSALNLEINYSQKGHIDDGSFYDTSVRTVRHIDYLEIPFIFKFHPPEKMPANMFICGGLLSSLVLADNIKYRENGEYVTERLHNLKKLDIGYLLGWGFYLSIGANKTALEIRFAQSADSIVADNPFLDIKNSVISLILSSNFRKFK